TTQLEELFAPEADSIASTDPASHARRRMDTNETRSLLVIDEGRLLGIVRRNALINESPSSLERPVSEFMSTDVPTVTRDQSVNDAHDKLDGDINTEQIPVVDGNGSIVGVINRSDLTGAMEPVGGSTVDGGPTASRMPVENGMTVKDSEGSNLGSVAEADFEVDGDIEFLVVEHGMIFKKKKRLPGETVRGVEDGDLHLAISSREFGMVKDLEDDE
ncbi:MAG: CBS domain-containing protein, partial [Thermomicrobiaceae bacterium]